MAHPALQVAKPPTYHTDHGHPKNLNFRIEQTSRLFRRLSGRDLAWTADHQAALVSGPSTTSQWPKTSRASMDNLMRLNNQSGGDVILIKDVTLAHLSEADVVQ